MTFLRKAFPWLAISLLAAAVVWAVSFGSQERAELVFNNGTEVQTIDPPKATGQPDGRVIEGLFQGLMQTLPLPDAVPSENGIVPVGPQPGVAESHEISEDGKTYTFNIRPNAKWSDGRLMNAWDFHWSWKRMLHPETASLYAYQLYYVRGAQAYNASVVTEGDPVEVELEDGRVRDIDPFPRGRLLRGKLEQLIQPPLRADAQARVDAKDADFDVAASYVYVVRVESEEFEGAVTPGEPETIRFCRDPALHADPATDTRSMRSILPDFEKTVGISCPDDFTLVVELTDSTPFFLDLVAFYPLFPTQRECVERHGVPLWTKPENIVTNGAYLLEFRRIRDRMRLRKSPTYWDAENVALETIDVLGVQSETTSLNMYLTGDLDWIPTVPLPAIPLLRKRDDFYSVPMLSVYFYRINVTRKPYDDIRVRRALNMAIDKANIAEHIARAGQTPATGIVPPGLPGYDPPLGDEYDPAEAKRLLDEVRREYAARGEAFPKLEILYNTNDAHRDIAQVIQNDWKTKLGVDVELRNLEWASYLDAQDNLQYQTARSGWIGDYADPNTFLDMWTTGNGNNKTGWSHEKYDKLVKEAQVEQDPAKRFALLRQAEEILVSELPIIPLYFYVSINMVKPHVKGFYLNLEDRHPLHRLSVERETR